MTTEKPVPSEFTKAQNILLKWLISDHTGKRVTVAEMHEVKKFIDSQQAELAEKDAEIERQKKRIESQLVSTDTQIVHDGILKQSIEQGLKTSEWLIEIKQLKQRIAELEEQLKKPRPKTGLSEEEEQ